MQNHGARQELHARQEEGKHVAVCVSCLFYLLTTILLILKISLTQFILKLHLLYQTLKKKSTLYHLFDDITQ